MLFALTYLAIVVWALSSGKIEKHLHVSGVSVILALGMSVVFINIFSISLFVAIKIIMFLYVKIKAILIKKILGFFAVIIGSFVPFVGILIWIVFVFYFYEAFKSFYKAIFHWMQRKLCQLRDMFDSAYEAHPLGYALLPLEVFIVSSPTAVSMWMALESTVEDSPTAVLRVFTCAGLAVWVYVFYRRDTDKKNRPRGDGIDYDYSDIVPIPGSGAH